MQIEVREGTVEHFPASDAAVEKLTSNMSRGRKGHDSENLSISTSMWTLSLRKHTHMTSILRGEGQKPNFENFQNIHFGQKAGGV